MHKWLFLKRSLQIVLLFLILSTGCNTKSKVSGKKPDTAIIGSWKLTKMSSSYHQKTSIYKENQLEEMGLEWILELKKDNTAEQYNNMNGPDITQPGTFKTTGDTLILNLLSPFSNDEFGTNLYIYSTEEDTLKLNWTLFKTGTAFNAEFIRQE